MGDDNFGPRRHCRVLRRGGSRECDRVALFRPANGEGLCRRVYSRSLFFAGLERNLSARAIAVVHVTLPKVKRAGLVVLSRLKSEINCWSKIASLVYLGSMTEPTSESLKQARSSQFCCPIVELRQYTLHPGKRDVLIDLFEREFIETQEAVGSKVIGQFRNVEDPDRFVWLRGFSDMTSRTKALQDFYGGPVWKTHREATNATMIDSDNVLLLHPPLPTSGFSLQNMKRPRIGEKVPASLVI